VAQKKPRHFSPEFCETATVLDCFSKKVVGYAIAEHIRTELVTDALRVAARNLPFQHGETIFHSDRGVPAGTCRANSRL